MPRVLHLVPQLDPGGVENHLLSLVKALPAHGYQADVAFLRSWMNGMVSAFEASGSRVFDLKMGRRFSFRAIVRLARLLCAGNYELLHTHLPRADWYGVCANMFARRLHISTKHSQSYSVTSPFGRLVGKFNERFIVHSVAISEYLRAYYMCQRIVQDPNRITTIHYGINRDEFLSSLGLNPAQAVRSELGIPADALVIGSVGRLVAEKEVLGLLKAFALVTGVIDNVHCLLVGDGPQRAELEAWAAVGGLEHHVTFAGYRRDVARLMAAMDVFTLNSRREAFGMVLLEAMALGLPVVSTTTGSIPEIVVEDVTGHLVTAGDERQLASRLIELLRSPEKRQAMGNAGRQRAETEFSVSRMVEKTIDVYRSVMEQPR
jgi:glycosyltransferase involved in cell wall biosynthesis